MNPDGGDGFFARVYALVREIPRGRVATYGQLAALLGSARGARAVGWALRALHGTTTPRVPWHRVVGAGGRISLPEQAGGLVQRRLLRAEGVRFTKRGVDLAGHGLWPPRPPDPGSRRYSSPTRGSRRVSRAR